MRRSAWIATTSIATLGLLFALGVVPVELQPRAEAQMSQPPPKDDESLGPVDAALAQEADRLGALDAITQIVNSNPTVFGGVSTTGSSQVAVYVSGNDAVAALPLQQIRRAADTVGVSLTVERRTYSLAELNEVQRRIVEDDALGPAERLVGLEIEVVPARNIVELRVPASLGADFEADARELFGALVEFSPLEDMPMEQDRFNDTSPFYRGQSNRQRYGLPYGRVHLRLHSYEPVRTALPNDFGTLLSEPDIPSNSSLRAIWRCNPEELP